jgi:hypothetical protein
MENFLIGKFCKKCEEPFEASDEVISLNQEFYHVKCFVMCHVDAPKPPGGALFWRNAGKHHLANYELKPESAIDGS